MMSYEYEFDDRPVGDLLLSRSNSETLQNGLRLLCDELKNWNKFVEKHGATEKPYAREADDLNKMIERGETLLREDSSERLVWKVSIGSMRYAEAAVMLMIHRRMEALASETGAVPSAVLSIILTPLEELHTNLQRYHSRGPSAVLWELS